MQRRTPGTKGGAPAPTGGREGLVRACFVTRHHIDTDHHRSSTVALSPGDRGGVSPATPPVLAEVPGEDPGLAARKAAHACGQGGGICRRPLLHRPHGRVLHRRLRRGPPGDRGLQRLVLRLGRPARPRHRARPSGRLAAAAGPAARGPRLPRGAPAPRGLTGRRVRGQRAAAVRLPAEDVEPPVRPALPRGGRRIRPGVPQSHPRNRAHGRRISPVAASSPSLTGYGRICWSRLRDANYPTPCGNTRHIGGRRC